MLTDKQIADALDLIDDRYHGVITKYLQKVGKTINEIGHLNQSSVNLLIQLRRMGVDVQSIERELQKATKLTQKDIKTLYRKAAQEANTDARFSYVSKGVEPDTQRWEALVEDIWKQTAGTMDNLANSSVITENYRDAIDVAVQAVTMGAADYNSVIRDTVKRIGRAGIQVEYGSTYIAADGQLKHHKRRLDSAVRQNVLDGIRQVQQKAQELIGEEIGADGVDITAHPNSAPDHEPVQGRRFDLANFQKMQSGQSFADVDGNHYLGFERPITQWRCRHLIYYILLGITKRMYTDEQLKSWEQENQKGCIIDGKPYTNYQATQLMRNLETEIRRQKDTAVLAKESGDDVLRRECQSNINKLTKKYNAVAEAAGLRKQMQKTRVEGYTERMHDASTVASANRIGFSQVKISSIKDATWRKECGSSTWSAEKCQSLFNAEQEIVNRRTEKSVLYTENGEVIFEKTGDKGQVRFTGEEIRRMRNGVLTHNHPNNTCFSPEDIHTLFNAKLSEIRAVTQDGIYRLQKPLTWPRQKYSLDKIEEIYYAIDKDVCVPLYAKAYAGQISFAEAEKLGQIEVIKELGKRYGLAFEFETWEDSRRRVNGNSY